MIIADPAGAMMQGTNNALLIQQRQGQMQDAQRQREQQNALADLYRTQGQGLAQGDPNAVNALAQIDPMAAFDMRRQSAADQRAERQFQMQTEQHGQQMESGQLGMQVTRQQLESARQQGKIAAAEHAANMSEQEREAELQKMNAGLSSAAAAYQQGPEFFSTWMQQNADNLGELGGQLTYDNFPIIAAGVVGASEGLQEVLKSQGMTGAPKPDYQIIDGQYVDKNNPQAGAQDVPGLRDTPDDSAAEEKIARLVEAGLDRNTAIGIVDGRFAVSRDPYTNQVQIIAKGTGAPLAPQGASQPQQQGQTGQAAPMALPQPPQQGLWQGAGQSDLSFGQDVPTGGEQAFGLGGVARNLANTASDAVGMGEVFPNAAEQQRFFKLMEEDLLVDLAQAYGRQPAQQLMQNIRSLLPQAGTLEGAERARGELEQLKRRFSRDLASAQSQMTAPGGRPEDRDAMRERATALRSTLGTIDEAITRLGGSPGGHDGNSGTTSSGISWSVD